MPLIIVIFFQENQDVFLAYCRP